MNSASSTAPPGVGSTDSSRKALSSSGVVSSTAAVRAEMKALISRRISASSRIASARSGEGLGEKTVRSSHQAPMLIPIATAATRSSTAENERCTPQVCRIERPPMR